MMPSEGGVIVTVYKTITLSYDYWKRYSNIGTLENIGKDIVIESM